MKISAKADYAVRAMIELAGATEERPVPGEQIAGAQAIPLRFLDPILTELRFAGFVQRRLGEDGGYWLDRPPGEVTLAEIISELDGPLANLRGEPPEELSFRGDARPLREVWIALGANMRQVLDSVTIADLVSGQLPELVRTIASRADAGQTDTHLDTSGG